MSDRPSSALGVDLSIANRRRVGCIGGLVALAAILALLAGFLFFRFQTAASGFARDAFLAVAHLQPKITVDEHVIFEQTSPVLELAVVERDVSVERETSNSWMGSTKRMRVRAVYHVKAGFDLQQPFDVRLQSEAGGPIIARLPPARLLSAEQVRLETLDLHNGMWNRIAPAEIQAELNTLNTEARLKALDAGMPREAEAVLTQQLREKLGAKYPAEISYAAPALR